MTEKEKYVLDNYEITKDGEVYSTLNSNNNYKRKKLSKRVDKDGYFDITLVYNNKGDRKPFRIHRLVLLKYKKEIEGYNIVNHKDLNKQNNHIDNLEWSTVSLNTQHGYDNGSYSHIKRVKSIYNNEVHIFPSISHASRYFGYANPSSIHRVLQGLNSNPIARGSRKGLYFEFTNESVTTIERNINTAVEV